MRYFLIITFLFGFIQAYEYFPDDWPMHKELQRLDRLTSTRYNLIGEKPIKDEKGTIYRVDAEEGTVSIRLKEKDHCDISYYEPQKLSFTEDGIVKKIKCRLENLDNCKKIINYNLIDPLIKKVSLSLPEYFFLEGVLTEITAAIELRDCPAKLDPIYYLYHFKFTDDHSEIETVSKFVKNIRKVFIEKGIVKEKPNTK